MDSTTKASKGKTENEGKANKTAKQFEQNLSKESCPMKTKFNKMQQQKKLKQKQDADKTRQMNLRQQRQVGESRDIYTNLLRTRSDVTSSADIIMKKWVALCEFSLPLDAKMISDLDKFVAFDEYNSINTRYDKLENKCVEHVRNFKALKSKMSSENAKSMKNIIEDMATLS